MGKKITLLEALTGCVMKIQHLDGTNITVATAPTDIISGDNVKVVLGKGMPFYNDSITHGNLIIKFDIEFPKSGSIKKEHREVLKGILPGPKVKEVADMNYLLMEDFHKGMENDSHEGGHKNTRDEDEDEYARRGQNVQCGSQ